MIHFAFEKHSEEPTWYSERLVPRADIPRPISDWIFDSHSLTRRLQSACKGHFHVHIVRQGWGRPMLNEARKLNIATTKFAFIREVLLMCGDAPWVFARTIIPAQTLRGRLQHLAHLGQKPLGEVLFSDPLVHRGEMEIAKLAFKQPIFTPVRAQILHQQQAVWARRSLFTYRRRPLLVTEIFLYAAGSGPAS